MDYPLNHLARRYRRDQISAAVMERARIEARQLGRSIKCQADRHSDQTEGCANDGTGCLCDCHDTVPG